MRLDNPVQLYNYINKCRKWIKVWNPQSYDSPKGQFSLTTYNILSQNLLLNHLYLYQDNIKSNLMWSHRAERLKKELLEMNSDIFCLQEVHMENFKSHILPSLIERGYQAVFKQKTGPSQDGCSILFKRDKFIFKDSREVEFNRRDISNLLDKDNVALLVKLNPIGFNNKSTDTDLVIANTHLLFNPKRGDIKIAQLRLLLAEIQQFARTEQCLSTSANRPQLDPFKLKYSPIIFCGDMNSEPSSPLIRFIKDGRANFNGLLSGDISGQREGIQRGRELLHRELMLRGIGTNSCYKQQSGIYNCDAVASTSADFSVQNLAIEHVFKLASAYPAIDEFGKKFYSMSTYLDIGFVDHIFYSFKHENLRLSAFRQLLTKRNLNTIGTFPNSVLGSDHIALSAKLTHVFA
ncbi:PREDICTED: protein angel homolog 2-like [Rhagoletis zephyria]|uniref:protein angel homolog 2-like n=1 Tax=Rhagoletis zephyria TaxID=28612 RepID=UPI0008116785|nr:PREDICTED: protein angel homolog 2-like [Rhagoletis zephyria]